MPKIARNEDYAGSAERGAENVTKIARSTAREGVNAAREGKERALNSATEAAENGREIVQRSAEESAELGWSIMELLGEQTRHNMQVATAFRRAMDWGQVAEMQREFLAGSFDRMVQLGERYRVMMQAGMKSTPFTTRR